MDVGLVIFCVWIWVFIFVKWGFDKISGFEIWVNIIIIWRVKRKIKIGVDLICEDFNLIGLEWGLDIGVKIKFFKWL